jgi:hypothetical protein
MKFLKIALVIFVVLINLTIAQSAWADRLKVSKNADYIEVTWKISKEANLQFPTFPKPLSIHAFLVHCLLKKSTTNTNFQKVIFWILSH